MKLTTIKTIWKLNRPIVTELSQMKLLRYSIIYAVSFLFIIALVDYVTGYELQFFVFYYIPLFVFSSNRSRFHGYLLAITAALCWLAVDIISEHSYTFELYRIWNTLIRAISFLVIVELQMRLQNAMRRLQKLYSDLAEAKNQVKVLKGILPICCTCKRIRDSNGKWEQMESYIHHHSEADFTHSLCPECMTKLYPDISFEKS